MLCWEGISQRSKLGIDSSIRDMSFNARVVSVRRLSQSLLRRLYFGRVMAETGTDLSSKLGLKRIASVLKRDSIPDLWLVAV